jgi:hypothetical protein
MAAEAKIAYPEWTEYARKNGLDPLGMQTSSVGYYQTLLPGISNVTLRIRYYGYYAWLSDIYAKKLGDTNPATWQKFIRRAEAFYALVAQAKGGETGIAGVTWAANALEEAGDQGEVDFSVAADPGSDVKYLKQAWGAYGAAYGSQLYAIDIFAEREGHDIPVPSPAVGKLLADAFAESISNLEERWFEILEAGSVQVAELEEFRIALPSDIPPESMERELYESLLFDQLGLEKHGHSERRKTLLLILELTQRVRTVPSVAQIRWMLFGDIDLEGKPLSILNPELREHAAKWRVYQANDILHVAYETLLKYSLDILDLYPAGISLAALVDECISRLDQSDIDLDKPWSEFVQNMDISDPRIDQDFCTDILKYNDPKRFCGEDIAASALTLLARLIKRASTMKDGIDSAFGELEKSVFKSLETEMSFLNDHASLPVNETLALLLDKQILKRHLWVAMRKLRYQGDYTFLFDSDDGKVRLRVKDGPVLTNPRLGPAVTFLRDIGLIGESGVTDLGRKVLVST